MIRRVQQTIIERGLIRPGMNIVAGVSGGADSTALLYALWFLRDRLHFQLFAAHLHHGLRGRDADRDAQATERMCLRLNIPIMVKKEAVSETRKKGGISFEMAAREARQDFFREVVKAYRADAVAVAHTRNDQAETVMMRLLQGTGIEGLGGMQYRNEPVPGLRVIRPMLDVSRDMIEEFLRRHQLGWREDRSNRDQHYLRNKIRHAILPAIEAHGFAHISQTLVRLSELMREESSLINGRMPALMRTCRAGKADGGLSAARVRALAVAEQRRVVRRWLMNCGLGERTLDFVVIERVRRLLDQDRGQPMQISDTHRVVCAGGRITCRRNSVDTDRRHIKPVRLAIPGKTRIESVGLEISVRPCLGFSREVQKIGRYPAILYFKREKGTVPDLVVRSRREGDSITPTGMTGRVSLKELLINAKVPVNERADVPVLVSSAGDVVWVAGYRVAAGHAVTGPGAPAWKLVIERKPSKRGQ